MLKNEEKRPKKAVTPVINAPVLQNSALELNSLVYTPKMDQDNTFQTFEQDIDDELNIFGDLPRGLYKGTLPRNCRVKIHEEDEVRPLTVPEGIHRSALSDSLRKTRGFRLDSDNLKRESLTYAQKIHT